MRARLTLATVFALALAGCAGSDDRQATPPPPPPASARARPLGPGDVLLRFLAAARARDLDGVWAVLSQRARARTGSKRAALVLAVGEDPPVPGVRYGVVLAERITEDWAVAAATAGSAAYAAALRLERGGWRLEVGGPLRIRILRPRPGDRIKRRTQLAAEVKGGPAITEAGLWLDGVAIPSRGGRSPNGRALTMFAESGTLDAGRHTVIAFASGGDAAAARIWLFTVKGSDLSA